MFHRNIFLLPLLLLSACVREPDSFESKNIDMNGYRMSNYHSESSRTVRVDSVFRPWNGALKGGKEQFAARKQMMTSLAQEQMTKVCNGSGHSMKGDPYFVMVDRDYDQIAGQYGAIGSLMGSALAAYNSEDENLPVSGTFTYVCASDKP